MPLVERMRQVEDGFTERKESAARHDVMKVLVGFANSVPPGRDAVLYIGVRDDGQVVGVGDPDKVQRDVRQWADECYPPVTVQSEALTVADGRTVVAVVVPSSSARPHFAGQAYKRVGSSTVKASPELFEEMIAARHSKAGAILRHRDGHPTEPVTVVVPATYVGSLGKEELHYLERECRIEGCTAHSAQLFEISAGRHHSVPLDTLLITEDPMNIRQLRLKIMQVGWW